MAAGLATLSVLREEKLVENAAAMGNRLAERLRAVGSSTRCSAKCAAED